MAKTIVFKKEFEVLLKKHKVKTRFVKELRRYCNENQSHTGILSKRVKDLNNKENFYFFIAGAFVWNTEGGISNFENSSFWYKIAVSNTNG
jgi:hypothetical protein